MKSIGIMQPYFLPYIGYFQLMNMVDEFILYDNIQFTKKGWIHRNRMLQNGKDEYFTLPIKKDSDYLNVCDRFLADTFTQEKTKLLNRIRNNYGKAPYFDVVFPHLLDIFDYNNINLFNFIHNSLLIISKYLGIQTPITVSSTVDINHDLNGKDKVLALTKAVKGTHYINPIGGMLLYDRQEFEDQGIKLSFFKTNDFSYVQLRNDYIPFLSILDVMMFNDKDKIRTFLQEFVIVNE